MKKFWMLLMAVGLMAGFNFTAKAETAEKTPAAEVAELASPDVTTMFPTSGRERSGHYVAESDTLPYRFKRVGRSFLLFVPNLVLDVTDLVSMEFGVGAMAALDLKITDFAHFGFISGQSYFAGKNFNRQLGYGRHTDYECSVGWYSARTIYYDNASSLIRPIAVINESLEPVDLQMADYQEGNLDPWAVGVNVGLGMDFAVYFHPTAVVDLVAGVFFLDVDDDNL